MTRRSTRLRRRWVPLVGACAVVLVVGCGSGPAPSDDEQTAAPFGVDRGAPVTAGELPTRGPSDLSDLDAAARGLAPGDSIRSDGITTTVVRAKRRFPAPKEIGPPGAGEVWAGAEVRTCFEGAAGRQVEVGSYLVAAIDADGIASPGAQPHWSGWPLPQYPGFGRIDAGQCTSGWVVIAVPREAALEEVAVAGPEGGVIATWRW